MRTYCYRMFSWSILGLARPLVAPGSSKTRSWCGSTDLHRSPDGKGQSPHLGNWALQCGGGTWLHWAPAEGGHWRSHPLQGTGLHSVPRAGSSCYPWWWGALWWFQMIYWKYGSAWHTYIHVWYDQICIGVRILWEVYTLVCESYGLVLIANGCKWCVPVFLVYTPPCFAEKIQERIWSNNSHSVSFSGVLHMAEQSTISRAVAWSFVWWTSAFRRLSRQLLYS